MQINRRTVLASGAALAGFSYMGGDIQAANGNTASIRSQITTQNFDGSGFTGAIWTEETKNGTSGHVEIYTAQSLNIPIVFHQPTH